NGTLTIPVTIDDGEAENSVSNTFNLSVTVGAINNAPVISGIPSQTISEGMPFNSFDLDDLVEDADHLDADLTWSVNDDDSELKVDIDDITHIATINIPNENWTGTETITFTVSDGDLSDSEDVVFTVSNIDNDPPVITEISDVSISEGNNFNVIDLDASVSDPDHSDEILSWQATGQVELSVEINSTSHELTVTVPNTNWIGAETITLTVTDGSLSDTQEITFTVSNSDNDPPVITEIADVTISEGDNFDLIDLDVYVSDPDHSNDVLTWVATGQSQLSVVINSVSHEVTITAPNENWTGSETVTFTVSDGVLSDTEEVIFTVLEVDNDAPVISDISDQSINEGAIFTTFDLDDYVTDSEQSDSEISWTATGQSNLIVTIDPTSHIATVNIPNTDWFGSEIISFIANDGVLTDTENVTFTVQNVNDAPVFADIANVNITEGNTFASFDLDDYISDVDHLDSELTIIAAGQTDLIVNIDEITHEVSISAPSLDWDEAETITFTVSDGDLEDSDLVQFSVTGVNDAPQLIDIPNFTINEGENFATVDLNIYVDDVDNVDSEISWTYAGNGELEVNISPSNIASVSAPNANWFGSATITFTASDGQLSANDESVFLINAVNDAPIITGQSPIEIDEDEVYSLIPNTINVSDVDNEYPTEHTINISDGANYSVSNGSVTPNENYNGTLTIPITVEDIGTENSLSNSFNLVVTVNSINDAPVITGQSSSISINEDEQVSINISDLVITDPDNVVSDFVLTTYEGDNYSVVANAVVPDENYSGLLSVDVAISDEETVNNLSNRFTVSILVIAQNDTPESENFALSTAENQNLNIDIANHVSDVDDNLDISTLRIVSDVSHGTTSVNTTLGRIAYMPVAGYFGVDELTYEVCDTDGACSSGVVTITVSNEAPSSTDSEVNLNEDNVSIVNVMDNVSDPQNNIDLNTLRIITSPDNGTASILSGGRIQYTPNANYFGLDELMFEVCDDDGYCTSARISYEVAAINDQPVITGQNSLVMVEDNELTISLNDLTVSDIDNNYPNDFILQVQPGANYTYTGTTITPNNDFAGELSVNVLVNDQSAENNLSEVYSIAIEVTGVNDKPIIEDQVSLTTQEDTPIEINITDLTIIDPDNNYPDDFVLVLLPGLNYTVNGTELTPAENYYGGLNVPIYVDDQEDINERSRIYNLVVRVDPVNDAPVANIINRSTQENVSVTIPFENMVSDVDDNIDLSSFENTSEPLNGTLDINLINLSVTYIPNSNPPFAGEDSFNFIFTDTDGLQSNESQVIINVTNQAPNAIDDAFSVNEDESVVFNVLTNDVDPQDNLDVSTLVIVLNPINGQATIDNTTGELTYTPNANFSGTETISYRISDTDGYSDEAPVTITVLPVNDLPIAVEDEVETEEDVEISIDVLDNDNDIDSDFSLMTLVVNSQPANGTASVDEINKVIIYSPNDDYNGMDEFVYTLCDAEGGCSEEQSVTIIITAVNDAPVAEDDVSIATGGIPRSISVVDNDIDIDGNLDITSINVTTPPINGTFTVESINGEIIYTANSDFAGTDILVYSICDTNGACDEATVTITVAPKDAPPVCQDVLVNMVDGENVQVNLLDHVTDENPSTLTILLGDYTLLNGLLEEGENGLITYASLAGEYCIEEIVSYQACDEMGNCDEAEIMFAISADDQDNDGIPTFIEAQYGNSDTDEWPDFNDEDSDNDGISDAIEAGIADPCVDLPLDTDDDGIPDYRDLDSDNDLVPDEEEGSDDCDNDGIPDFRDNFDDCAERIDAPETFSPNGDGINDTFTIPGLGDIEGSTIYVYNRWGGEVFSMQNYDNSWDGTSANSAIGSKELPQGTYYYVVKLSNGNVLKGMVYIKR
ncbi:Ig-like domain-containing protein, partial [Labilibacter marinus]|uniref:Ig-like domain-containing protein n=1 Tax=Labilibacter marinus TaxID=1477105 RepID=UPI0009502014